MSKDTRPTIRKTVEEDPRTSAKSAGEMPLKAVLNIFVEVSPEKRSVPTSVKSMGEINHRIPVNRDHQSSANSNYLGRAAK